MSIRRMRMRAGNTLIEVIVACFVMAMTTVAIASLLLSTFAASKREIVQYEITFAAKKLREQLKSYVTADTYVTLNAPGSPPWHLPDDSSCNNCWALAEGEHNATSILSQELRTNYNATMRYTVTKELFLGRQIPKVRIVVDWSLP